MIRHIISTVMLVAVSHSVKEYRSDFEYNRETDAFYKLHTESVGYDLAKSTCEAEDAKLLIAYPKDVVQAHSMLKRFPDIGELIWAGDDGLLHEPVDILQGYVDTYFSVSTESHLTQKCEVITREGEVYKVDCTNEYPFICKVDAKDAPYNPQCKVFSTGYQYLENVGSCYKISSAAFSWNQAYAECRAEGAHLLVLNSELEHQAVHNLTHYAPKITDNAHAPWYWLAGIRAEKTNNTSPVVYKTIFGQTLKEAGFDQWSEGEPNNLNGNELCGSIFTNDGKYNDLNCYHLFAFICEKEIKGKI